MITHNQHRLAAGPDGARVDAAWAGLAQDGGGPRGPPGRPAMSRSRRMNSTTKRACNMLVCFLVVISQRSSFPQASLEEAERRAMGPAEAAMAMTGGSRSGSRGGARSGSRRVRVQDSEGGMKRLETLIELKFLNSSLSSFFLLGKFDTVLYRAIRASQ